MKTVMRILTWAGVAAAIMWWPTRPTGFNARWVSLPPSMTLEMFDHARRASERPAAMTYCKYPDCKRS